MDIDTPLSLLGGLTPSRFMKRHWHKKPLLVRGAIPDFKPAMGRAELFALAACEGVESRLIVRDARGWTLRQGPLARRSLPPLRQPRWTLLVQGVDLHHEAVHRLLQQFRFVPDARLDDLMISYASDGGGVGPHFDSYDVFLLQAHGRRRWRIGRQKDLSLVEDVPLKILRHFEPEEEFVLEPGDLLYLPPRWAHDGVAEGECMTWSIGFRSPQAGELARELLMGMADVATDLAGPGLYRDPDQMAVDRPAAIPPQMLDFARQALDRTQSDPQLLALLLGEYLSAPKVNVWFDAPDGAAWTPGQGVVLDRRTRMLYDDRHIFINGEGFRAGGRDARLLRQLADARRLDHQDCLGLGPAARQALADWSASGWVWPVSQNAARLTPP